MLDLDLDLKTEDLDLDLALLDLLQVWSKDDVQFTDLEFY